MEWPVIFLGYLFVDTKKVVIWFFIERTYDWFLIARTLKEFEAIEIPGFVSLSKEIHTFYGKIYSEMPTTKIDHTAIRSRLIKISKIHMLIALFFVVQIIAYDAAKLITPEVVLNRWFFTGGLLLASVLVWYFAKLNKSPVVLRNLTWFLVAVDLIFATFNIYTQRGMSSRAVILYILAIFTISILRIRSAIFLTSMAAAISYSTAAVAYFVLNFNEGYKIELYGEIGLYSAMLLAFGSIAWAVVKQKR